MWKSLDKNTTTTQKEKEKMEWLNLLCYALMGVDAVVVTILYVRERLRRKEAEALYKSEADHSREMTWRMKKYILELQADKSRLELEIQGMLAEIDASAENKYQEFKKELEERDGDV
jgi:hypothetical protein